MTCHTSYRCFRFVFYTSVVALAILCGVNESAIGERAPQTSDPVVGAVNGVQITVRAIEESVRFYTDVLSFEKVAEFELAGEEYEQLFGIFGLRVRVATLALGDERIDLVEFMTPTGRAIPETMLPNDHSFQHIAIIVSDMERAYERLRDHNVRHASPNPQTLPDWNPNASGIKAFYFRDPDGHFLEILEFPQGKGDAKWHRETDRLFLGIDHTAIVVSDTESSLELYRDFLGMRIAGESVNYGQEQERLNNVFGARVRITTLKAETGPAIELLEYLSPRTGRPAPADSKANDLWHWRIRLEVSSEAVLRTIYEAKKVKLVSPAVISITGDTASLTHGFLGCDPDGHAILFENK